MEKCWKFLVEGESGRSSKVGLTRRCYLYTSMKPFQYFDRDFVAAKLGDP